MPIIPPLIIDQYGAFLGKHSERLQVRVNKDVGADVPLFGLEQVLIIAGGLSLSSDAVRACAEAGVPISFVSRSGKPYARVASVDLIGTVQTRWELLLAYADGRGVTLAKAFAQGKLLNQVNLLKYMAKYRKTRGQETYQFSWPLAEEIKSLDDELEKLSGGNVDAIRPQLLNLEGRAANLYWEGIKRLLLAEVEFRGREQRGAQDVVNVCLPLRPGGTGHPPGRGGSLCRLRPRGPARQAQPGPGPHRGVPTSGSGSYRLWPAEQGCGNRA